MSYTQGGGSRPPCWVGWMGKAILFLLPVFLLWWAFQRIPLRQVYAILQGMELAQLLLWLAFNAGLIVLMCGRWWLILRVLEHPVAFLALTRYRLAAFAVSYFTPGPQFGGEPLQVLALRQRHQVPAASGVASVSLDRLLELIANFTFLVFGTALALSQAWFPEDWREAGMAFSLGLLAFPLGYLVLMLAGIKPLSRVAARLPGLLVSTRFIRVIQEVENQMSRFCVEEPRMVLAASLVSLVIWTGLVGEYWLLTWILGLRLTFMQAVSALVAARLALLTPLPGGLGAVEASQVLAFQTLGFDPSYGAAIALLIRTRDLFFGGLGWISVVSLIHWRPRFLSRMKEFNMTKQTLRYVILVLGIITGVIHAVVLNLINLDWLMLLNGLGFFVLTAIVFFDPASLSGPRRFIHYLFMAYTLVTIIGFFALNDTYGPLGIIAKVDEVLLLVALYLHLTK